jgi:hypothetical protein
LSLVAASDHGNGNCGRRRVIGHDVDDELLEDGLGQTLIIFRRHHDGRVPADGIAAAPETSARLANGFQKNYTDLLYARKGGGRLAAGFVQVFGCCARKSPGREDDDVI